MRKAYIFAYNEKFGDRVNVKKALDAIPQILNYRADLIPNVFYLVSEHEAQALSDAIKAKFPQECAFIISECTNNKQGYLTQEAWNILNNAPLAGA